MPRSSRGGRRPHPTLARPLPEAVRDAAPRGDLRPFTSDGVKEEETMSHWIHPVALAAIVALAAACDRGSAAAPSGSEPTAAAPASAPSAAPAAGPLAVGTPAQGSFGTSLPVDGEGKPYIDYPLTVAAVGSYRIDLVSSDTSTYDPYVRLLRGTDQVGEDDDGGGDLQSRLVADLQPGAYTVRVTRYGAGQLDSAVSFTLTVSQEPATASVAP